MSKILEAKHGWKKQASQTPRDPRTVHRTAQPADGCSVVQTDLPRCGLAFLMTAFTVAFSKRFSISGIWSCASNGSDVTFGCCSYSPTALMPARRSACALPVAIAAGSYVGCFPRSVASVLLSRGAAGRKIRALTALVMPPRWYASLLAHIRRASGISSRAFCRLLPANTTSQSMRPVISPLVYSL